MSQWVSWWRSHTIACIGLILPVKTVLLISSYNYFGLLYTLRCNQSLIQSLWPFWPLAMSQEPCSKPGNVWFLQQDQTLVANVPFKKSSIAAVWGLPGQILKNLAQSTRSCLTFLTRSHTLGNSKKKHHIFSIICLGFLCYILKKFSKSMVRFSFWTRLCSNCILQSNHGLYYTLIDFSSLKKSLRISIDIKYEREREREGHERRGHTFHSWSTYFIYNATNWIIG